jgi:isocitrate dehydrogenase
VAAKIHNAWLRTLEDGVHTGDVYRDGVSKERVGTQDFAKAVVARLGQKPSTMPAVHYAAGTPKALEGRTSNRKPAKKELVGIDMFVAWTGEVDAIGKQIKALEGDGLSLVMLSNKGLKVWPDVALDGMHITDQFRCRFRMPEGKTVKDFFDATRNSGRPPVWSKSLAQTNTIANGGEAFISFRMPPGRYILSCLIPAADGRSHVAKGM